MYSTMVFFLYYPCCQVCEAVTRRTPCWMCGVGKGTPWFEYFNYHLTNGSYMKMSEVIEKFRTAHP